MVMGLGNKIESEILFISYNALENKKKIDAFFNVACSLR